MWAVQVLWCSCKGCWQNCAGFMCSCESCWQKQQVLCAQYKDSTYSPHTPKFILCSWVFFFHFDSYLMFQEHSHIFTLYWMSFRWLGSIPLWFCCSRFDQVSQILNSLRVCLPSDMHVCKWSTGYACVEQSYTGQVICCVHLWSVEWWRSWASVDQSTTGQVSLTVLV